jgi:hypothetical protein
MQRINYYKRYRRIYKKIISLHRELIKAALQKQISSFTDRYEKDVTTPIIVEKKSITEAVRNLYLDAAYINGKSVKKVLLKAMSKDEWYWVINEYFKRYLLSEVVEPITATTVKQIEKVLIQANNEGWGVDKTVRALKESPITKMRAELIVRTETTRASNAGAMIAAAESGFVMQKEWVSSQDNRTRRIPRDQYDHLTMDGVTTDFDGLFIVPSTKTIDAMQFPGDPRASAGNVCNCRCTLIFKPVRDRNGRLIPIERVPSLNPIYGLIAEAAASLLIGNFINLNLEENEAI